MCQRSNWEHVTPHHLQSLLCVTVSRRPSVFFLSGKCIVQFALAKYKNYCVNVQ